MQNVSDITGIKYDDEEHVFSKADHNRLKLLWKNSKIEKKVKHNG